MPPNIDAYIKYHKPGEITPPDRLKELVGDMPIACYVATCLCWKEVVYSFVTSDQQSAYLVAMQHLIQHRLSCDVIMEVKRAIKPPPKDIKKDEDVIIDKNE